MRDRLYNPPLPSLNHKPSLYQYRPASPLMLDLSLLLYLFINVYNNIDKFILYIALCTIYNLYLQISTECISYIYLLIYYVYGICGMATYNIFRCWLCNFSQDCSSKVHIRQHISLSNFLYNIAVEVFFK